MTEATVRRGWPGRIVEWGGYARRRGRGYAFAYWLRWTLPLVGLWAVVAARTGAEKAWRGIKGFPHWARGSFDTSADLLSTKAGRRAVRRALFDEHALTAESRRAVLFLAFLFLLVSYLLVELLTFTLFPEVRSFKHQTDLLLFYGIASRIALPTPYEVVLLPAAAVLGRPTAIIVASLSAVIASWLLFLIGTEANHGLENWLGKRGWGRRFWTWLSTHAERFGYLLMFALLSIPLVPDSVTAVFAVLGLRLRPFLLTIFLSSLVRFTFFLWIVRGALG